MENVECGFTLLFSKFFAHAAVDYRPFIIYVYLAKYDFRPKPQAYAVYSSSAVYSSRIGVSHGTICMICTLFLYVICFSLTQKHPFLAPFFARNRISCGIFVESYVEKVESSTTGLSVRFIHCDFFTLQTVYCSSHPIFHISQLKSPIFKRFFHNFAVQHALHRYLPIFCFDYHPV